MKAFPLKAVNKFDDSEGMDLRDYFAAKAMQAIIINYAPKLPSDEVITKLAYETADAMMKAREGKS